MSPTDLVGSIMAYEAGEMTHDESRPLTKSRAGPRFLPPKFSVSSHPHSACLRGESKGLWLHPHRFSPQQPSWSWTMKR